MPPAVAFLGQPGSFSHEACLRFAPSHAPLGCRSFEEVIEVVRSGRADLGLLPVENNAAGPTGAGDLIASSDLKIVAEHDLPVRMQLLAMPGTELGDIAEVRGHPMAIRQCASFLARLGAELREASDSAAAAQAIDAPGLAALAPASAGAIFGLEIIARDVHDRPDNLTRFALIARSSPSGSAKA